MILKKKKKHTHKIKPTVVTRKQLGDTVCEDSVCARFSAHSGPGCSQLLRHTSSPSPPLPLLLQPLSLSLTGLARLGQPWQR